MSWTIALVQMDCVPGDVAANLQRIVVSAVEAADRGAQLVLFPECATTGYFVADRIASLAEPIPGPSSEQLMRLARSRGVHLMVGMIERAGDQYYDDAILFTPDGGYHVYRKAHLFGPERAIFTPGERPVVVDTALGRLALDSLLRPDVPRIHSHSGLKRSAGYPQRDGLDHRHMAKHRRMGRRYCSLAGTHPRIGEWRPRRHGRPRRC